MTELRVAAGPEPTAAELHGLLKLRCDVFVVEQRCPYPEVDGLDLDPDTLHLWWQPGAEPLACRRVLGAPGALRRIGRVCTAEAARGTGLGGRLMAAALEHIGGDESELHAQVTAQGLYARFGYAPEGEPYDDDGIMHVHMRRPAIPQAPALERQP